MENISEQDKTVIFDEMLAVLAKKGLTCGQVKRLLWEFQAYGAMKILKQLDPHEEELNRRSFSEIL